METGLLVLLLLLACAAIALWIAAGRGPAAPVPSRCAPQASLSDLAWDIAGLARLVEDRLATGLRAFLDTGNGARWAAVAGDDGIGLLSLRIHRALVDARARGLCAADTLRWQELLAAAAMLDHVAEAAHAFLRRLRQLEQRAGRRPRAEPIAEICSLHALVTSNLRLAIDLCIDRSPRLACELATVDAAFLALETEYRAAHMKRLSSVRAANWLASATHLEVLGLLRRMNLEACAFARTFQQLHAGGLPAPALSLGSTAPILAPS